MPFFQDFKVANTNHFTTVNTGTSGKVLAVDVNNQGSTTHKGLKWIDTDQVGSTTFTALNDTPGSIGSAHQILTVNAAGNALEFRALDANHLVNDIIVTAMIADDAITTALIADDAITNALLADNAAGTSQIANSAITDTKIATNAVTTVKILDNNVTTAKIAANAVTSAKLANDCVGDTQLGTITKGGQANTYTSWPTDNTKIDFFVNSDNEMRLEADGDLQVDGDVVAFSTTISSDEKLKNNIKNIESPIEKIQKINGVNFNWNDGNKFSAGVIAQDIQKVMPELVSEVENLNGNDTHLAVNYDGLIGLLIETVKEQQKQIDELKSNKSV